MKYQIVGKNITVTEGMTSAIQKKLEKLDKYFLINDDVNARVVCSTHDKEQKIEVTIFLPQMPLRAEVKNEDLYNAMDQAIDKLQGQMRKIKTRMDRSKDKTSLGKAFNFEQIADEQAEKDIVVRTKSYYLDPMTIEEAITRMDALGHDFYLYLDKEDNKVSVLYNRKDGGFGVIQAENMLK